MVDVSNPSSPSPLAWAAIDGIAGRTAYSDGHRFATSVANGLRIIDVRVPTSPVAVAELPVLDGANDVAVSGDCAAVVGPSGRLTIVDISVPSQPIEVGSAKDMDQATGVVASSGRVFISAGKGGLATYPNCSSWLFADDFESGDPDAWFVAR